MNKYWKINALSNQEAEVLIYEYIGEDFRGNGISAKRFADEIKALGDIRTLIIRLNSPGGDVFEGNSIYNILKSHKARIEVHIDGIAASIASVIAMAGDTIYMPENAMMMIHDPWGAVVGNAIEMRKIADALDKIKSSLVVAYRQKSGMDENKIIRLMAEETWFTAKEAVRHGLADLVNEPVKLAASFDLSYYKNVPTLLKQGIRSVSDTDKQANARLHRRRQMELLQAELEIDGYI